MQETVLVYLGADNIIGFAEGEEVGPDEYQVKIPAPENIKFEGVFNSKNFAVITMTFAFIFLLIMLIHACTKKSRNSGSESSGDDGFHDSLSYEYTYDEEYTNSYYQRSDDRNSIVDHLNFKYDQSLRDSNSRAGSSNNSESGDLEGGIGYYGKTVQRHRSNHHSRNSSTSNNQQ